jgi:hypothetical protein
MVELMISAGICLYRFENHRKGRFENGTLSALWWDFLRPRTSALLPCVEAMNAFKACL